MPTTTITTTPTTAFSWQSTMPPSTKLSSPYLISSEATPSQRSRHLPAGAIQNWSSTSPSTTPFQTSPAPPRQQLFDPLVCHMVRRRPRLRPPSQNPSPVYQPVSFRRVLQTMLVLHIERQTCGFLLPDSDCVSQLLSFVCV